MLELKRRDGSLIDRTPHKTVRRQAEAHKADLYKAYLAGADLCGAMLSGANLSGARLSGANLCGARLSGADLYKAELSWADLCGASLYGANLYRANLCWANLCGADLQEANLSKANLYQADLQGSLSAKWLSKWRGVNLLPPFEDGGVLAWKHVRLDKLDKLDKKRIIGNLDAEYAIGEPYECASMVCAGPWGAVREVSEHRQAAHWAETVRNPAPHLLAIHAAPGALYDYAPAKGVYYALRGTPVALYRVTDVDADGFTPVLVAGRDVFSMIEGEEG